MIPCNRERMYQNMHTRNTNNTCMKRNYCEKGSSTARCLCIVLGLIPHIGDLTILTYTKYTRDY